MSRARITAAGRIQRLLAMLRWAATQPDGVPIPEMCARFGFAPAELVKELEMASMIGAESPNYDDMPFEVFVEDGRVFVRLFSFDRPLRLTPAEGLALIVAADALVDRSGADDPLARALAKLGGSLGVDLDDAVEVDLGPDGGEIGRAIRLAIAEQRQVSFGYWTYGRDAVAQRTVSPWAVFSSEDAWYLAGLDHARGAERRFRLDRMQSVELSPDPAEPAPDDFEGEVVLPDSGPQVVLDLHPDARWVAEAHPILAAEELAGGHLRITLAIAGSSWLERLLLRLGPAARIEAIDPDLGDVALPARAAERVLRRYRGSGAGSAR